MLFYCTTCGQNDLQSNKTEFCKGHSSGSCSHCEELAEVDKRIENAKLALERVLMERQTLQTTGNQYHDPFSHRVPIELASRIFDFCMPPPFTPYENILDHDFSAEKSAAPVQLTLGAVCQRWRRIIWSRAGFWTNLSVNLSPDISLSHCDVVEDWLKRSGNLPLNIVLKLRDPKTERLGSFTRNLISIMVGILSQYLHRCTLLHLGIPQSFISKLSCTPPEDDMLNALILTCYRSSPDHGGVFNLGHRPRPYLLAMSGYRLKNVAIDPSRLGNFSGKHLRLDECIELLMRAPNLAKCKFAFVGPAEFHSLPNSAKPLSHPTLRDLRLDGDILPIIEVLSPPKLEALYCWPSTDSPIAAISSLIRRSGCSLNELFLGTGHLTQGPLEDNALLELLSLSPKLTDLDLFHPAGEIFFRRLADTTFWAKDNPSPLLPRLRRFEYVASRTFPWSSIHEIAPLEPPPSNMYKRNLSLIKFTINPRDWGNPEQEDQIPEEDLNAFLKIIESGIQLSIDDLQNGRNLINWWQRRHNGEELIDLSTTSQDESETD